ncbi:MAG TPA: AMP-binding protein [Steroidobacteraceae bacterium]|nr:AMP-binding protein [Steroidobacteraceae bacterium]
MTEPLPGRVASHARLRPRDPAVISLDSAGVRVWDWSRLWRESRRIAALLAASGVRRGEPIAYQMANRAEFVAITVGALLAGAVCCPLMPIFRERELSYMLSHARARVLFVMDRHHARHPAEEVSAIEAQVPSLETVVVIAADGSDGEGREPMPNGRARYLWWERALAKVGGEMPQGPGDAPGRSAPSALAQLLFTSGTTGQPKGVLHRADVLTQAARLQADHLGLGADERIFVPSPLAHQTGFLYGMWLALALGVPQILQESWEPRLALAALGQWRGTFVQAATPFLADLVQAREEMETTPGGLRLFVATGTTVPRALAARARRVLHADVCGAFGTTEGCLATLGSPADPPEKACGTDGRPLAGIEVRTCDEDGRMMPRGAEGQLQTRSPTMFEGYLDRPDWTAQAYTPEGWYRTGDLATIDGEGYLHLTGRVKDVVNRGGEKIPVVEIEQLLHEHDAVREVAIVGMPDERLGERACAFIVMRQTRTDHGGMDLAAVQAFLDRRRVAKQYWPERVEVVDELPKTPSGKIRKYLLRERAGALIAGDWS